MFAMFVVFCGRFVLYNEPVTLSEGGKGHEIKTLKEQKQTGTKTGQEHFLTRLGWVARRKKWRADTPRSLAPY